MANHGPVYGLSRELHIKNSARFNLSEAIESLEWIEDCTQVPLDPPIDQVVDHNSAAEPLLDGVQLCLLIERVAGRSVKFNHSPKMPFHKMENISTFLDMIRAYGVPEISTFQTVDLYERKQLYKVFECIRSLAGVAARRRASVPIPEFATRYSQESPRCFDKNVLNQGQTVISLQYGYNKGASQSGMTPYGLHRQIFKPMDNKPHENGDL